MENGIHHTVRVTLKGKDNETYSGTLILKNLSSLMIPDEAAATLIPTSSGSKLKDPTGASYYVIAVILVYGLSIVMLIASHIKRKHGKLVEDKQIHKYLQEYQVVKEKSSRDSYKNLKKTIMAKLNVEKNNTYRNLHQSLLPIMAVGLPAIAESTPRGSSVTGDSLDDPERSKESSDSEDVDQGQALNRARSVYVQRAPSLPNSSPDSTRDQFENGDVWTYRVDNKLPNRKMEACRDANGIHSYSLDKGYLHLHIRTPPQDRVTESQSDETYTNVDVELGEREAGAIDSPFRTVSPDSQAGRRPVVEPRVAGPCLRAYRSTSHGSPDGRGSGTARVYPLIDQSICSSRIDPRARCYALPYGAPTRSLKHLAQQQQHQKKRDGHTPPHHHCQQYMEMEDCSSSNASSDADEVWMVMPAMDSIAPDTPVECRDYLGRGMGSSRSPLISPRGSVPGSERTSPRLLGSRSHSSSPTFFSQAQSESDKLLQVTCV